MTVPYTSLVEVFIILDTLFSFAACKIFKVPNNVLLIGCYHPSPRNVNTGRINEKKMTSLFKKVLKLI